MQLLLHVIRDGPVGTTLRFAPGQYIFGRSEQCHVRLAFTAVNRLHCLLTVGPDSASVRDLESRSGTLVNYERIRDDRSLRNGDRLNVRGCEFLVQWVADDAAPGPAWVTVPPELPGVLLSRAAEPASNHYQLTSPATEGQWVSCDDPFRLINAVRDRVTARKARLVACACVRRVWDLLVDERSRHAVVVAERHADGLASAEEVAHADREADRARVAHTVPGGARLAEREAARAALLTCRDDRGPGTDLPLAVLVAQLAHINRLNETEPRSQNGEESPDVFACWTAGRTAQCGIIRDVFGGLVLPTFDPRWRTADTVGLATGIYEDRAVDRFGLLSDALQDAGCANEQVLRHCQSDSHVRGCYLIDLLLAKE